ncbi:MAG TPA: PrsW family intramembrane metalloprotease, partial [Thermoprotei archaeon]|nr:PrsW family intramembrane metalloprotease [Thermoprotei archaeon]
MLNDCFSVSAGNKKKFKTSSVSAHVSLFKISCIIVTLLTLIAFILSLIVSPLFFSVTVLPGLAYLIYVWLKDRIEREPLIMVFAVFSHGFIVSSILALILEVMLLSFLDVVTVVPVIEELAKFFGVFLASRWRRVFNEIDDGIVYGASSGLGFATLESILYSMKGHFLTIGTLRAFSSTLSHATASALFGYYYAVSLFTRRHFFTVIG